MTPNNFDYITPIYDALATFIFRGQILKAQTKWLYSIPPHADVLIIGGGSGKVLKELMVQQPHIGQIDYIEASAKMLHLAKKNCPESLLPLIHFIHGTEQSIPEGKQYGAVFTAFFLDVFRKEDLQGVFEKLYGSLKTDGIWLLTDFQLTRQSHFWQRYLVGLMYVFFKLTAQLEGNSLQPFDSLFTRKGMFLEQKALFFYDMIFASVWEKVQVSTGKEQM